jgi:phosphonate transport system ATP-binding protein
VTTQHNDLLNLAQITVRFGENTVLRGVDLVMQEGECVALVGPSGAGKSTLLGVCTANVVPATGSISFTGTIVRDNNHWRATHGRAIATVHQQLHLSGRLKVVHNVNAGRLGHWSTWRSLSSLVRPREVPEVLRLLERLGIADKIRMRTDLLSGGEQQRVAIARALRQEPLLILADEPTASLDPARADEIMGLLTEVTREGGHALLVSQHDAALARKHCRRMVGLRLGEVLFDSPVEQVDDDTLANLYAISSSRNS